MTSVLHPYAALKSSGVHWLCHVPEHWHVRRLRTVAEMRVSNVDKHTKEEEFPVRLCNYVDVYKNDRITQGIAFMSATASRDEIEKFRLNRNDVVITKDSEAWDDIGVPSLVTEPANDLISGYHLAIIRPRENTYGPYLFWALRSKPTAYQFHVEAKGVTRYGLAHHGIQSALIPHPPLSEQKAIVRFLDHADEQIQRYIAAKERLIALMEEQRQALAYQAVIRGRDPSVKFKDSGVEEIGEIPEGWLTSRVKHEFLSLNHVRVPLSSTERGAMEDRTYDYYGASGVIDQVENYLFDDELLLIAEDGANLVLRNLPLAIIARGKFWVNNHAHILKPRTGNLEFLAAVMEGVDYLPWISGAAQPKLTQERLMNVPVAVPSPAMQDEIMDKIGPTANATKSVIAQTRRQIDLMNEYRTRLIADVVTGQLDVREAAAQIQETPLKNKLSDEIVATQEVSGR